MTSADDTPADSPSEHDAFQPAKPQADWRRQIPNALTAARVVCAGIVVALLAVPGSGSSGVLLGAAAVLFITAAISDALDGFLARRWNAVSAFGRVMDPFADKVLVIGTLIMLAGPELGGASGVAPWMVVIVIARDLLVTSIRGLYEARGVDFSAGFSGKLKMVVQSIAVPLILALLLLGVAREITPAIRHAIDASAWILTVVTAGSALPYITRAVQAEKTLIDQKPSAAQSQTESQSDPQNDRQNENA